MAYSAHSYPFARSLLTVAGGSVNANVPLRRGGESGEGNPTVAGVTTVYIAGCTSIRRRGAIEGGAMRRRLRHLERRLLHPERPVALDERAGQPERHGQEPELLLSLRRESQRERVQRDHDETVHRAVSRARVCPAGRG